MIPSYVVNCPNDITYHIYMRNREYEILYDKNRKKWFGVYLAFGSWYDMTRKECLYVLERLGLKGQRTKPGDKLYFCPLTVVSI